ncbi:MAG: TrlF family AAA-like ATPase [Ferrimicrobium sp.]
MNDGEKCEMTGNQQGSLWRRWDPHIHAPGTLLNDQFGGNGSIDDYLDAIEAASPSLEAVGVTDYLTTRCYEAVAAAKHDKGRLAGVALLFPNIELRLSIETKKSKGINLHLLVSPDDPRHLERLNHFLARLTFEYKKDKYTCAPADLARLGRAHDPSLPDDGAALRAGVNQFKVDFRQLRSEFEDSEWMQANSLVAVAGSSTDGTAGLQTDNTSFAAMRKEIEGFAHIIFSSNERQAAFWCGELGATRHDLETEYGGLKPCLHGSDAHCIADVGRPDLGRYTWIKGDPVFESLRQACLEPRSRVYIGPLPLELESPERTLVSVKTSGAPWLLDSGMPLNPGLVAVIGARGSGKTALADLIAHAGGSKLPSNGNDSFLVRAKQFLSGVSVEVEWSNSDQSQSQVGKTPDDDPEVHYLSQKFVEHLCSAEGIDDELIEEIQKVVFEAHDPSARLEATNFNELLEERVGDTRRQRTYLTEQLDRISEDVLAERTRRAELPGKKKALEVLHSRLRTDKNNRDAIVKQGEKERAAYYERLQEEIDRRQRKMQNAAKRTQRLVHLAEEVQRYEADILPRLTNQLQSEYGSLALSEVDWAEFKLVFEGSPTDVIARHQKNNAEMINRLQTADPDAPATITSTADQLRNVALATLKDQFEKVSTEIGIDRQNAQKLKMLNTRISARQLEIEKAQRDIDLFEGWSERLKELVRERSEVYQQYFELVLAEEKILEELYQPLSAKLTDTGGSVGSLRLNVARKVDLQLWASRGEELIDLRKIGKFRGRGSLAQMARILLLPSWETGTAAEVVHAMSEFRKQYDQAIIEQANAESGTPEYQQWTLDVGRWLYSTDHISVTYNFEYEGQPLFQLSPGTRGIVLLLLYLALDVNDHRPLVIDQPEENLDPRSVFKELVYLFRNARARRQVIIVTHNANLVVNTDVDQVIVATCVRDKEGNPPKFNYHAGSLENAAIRTDVCEILEGGEAAFRERARRLRISHI